MVLREIFINVSKKGKIRFPFYVIEDLKKYSYHIKKGKNVLDVGSGYSPFKNLFEHEHYFTIDIDVKRKPQINGDIYYLPFKKDTFDLILCTEIFEHLMDLEKPLKELNRVLKKDQYLVVTIPFLFGIHENFDCHRYTSNCLSNYIEKNGFQVIFLNENGGIFCVICELLSQIPNQLVENEQSNIDFKNYTLYCIAFFYFLFLIPISRILLFLDRFDTKKRFTAGYSLLCKKV